MKKKIILAFDSFKGSLTSLRAGMAAAEAVKEVMPEMDCEIIPIADGGEGTVEALVSGLGGKYIEAEVKGPLGQSVTALYGLCGETAIIEMASASGLTLIEEHLRNPLLTTTYGTGELIRDAISNGCRKFFIGIGGSATNDAGTGMLQALGVRLLDKNGDEVGKGGAEAGRIAEIDMSRMQPELKECTFKVACDVTNPLTGPKGASIVFGPQKGADQSMAEKLDSCLANFAHVVAETLGIDYSTRPGAGAAGGLGFSLMAFLGAKPEPGIDMVLEAVEFDERIKHASLILTGEGCLDRQTCMGKAPYGVLKHAEKYGVPVIAIGGSLDPETEAELNQAGFYAVFPIISGAIPLSEALKPAVAFRNLKRTVSQILRTIKLTI